MAQVKVPASLRDLEYFFKAYFNAHIASMADNAVAQANKRFADDMDRIPDLPVNAGVPGMEGISKLSRASLLDSYKNYWTNVQANFRKAFESSKDLGKDMSHFVDEYQKVFVKAMGAQKYMAASKELGQDLAAWYVNNKLLERTLNRMASHGAPKSSLDYLIRKGADVSVLGLLQPSDWNGLKELQERQYNPSGMEKLGAYAVGGAFDYAMIPFGGLKSAMKVAAVGTGLDLVVSSDSSHKESVDTITSRVVFGSEKTIRMSRTLKVYPETNSNVQSMNKMMQKKVTLRGKSPLVSMLEKEEGYPMPLGGRKKQSSRDGIPSVVAFGKEEEYRKEQAKEQAAPPPKEKTDTKKKSSKETVIPSESSVRYQATNAVSSSPMASQPYNQISAPQYYAQGNSQSQGTMQGWGNLVDKLGMTGFTDVFKNLGYVLAMLPDLLIGMFTGRTKSLNLKDNMMPIAAIIFGMFVRNPMLKMLLIGLGGANLLNKATHEILDDGDKNRSLSYKTYQDEPLNPRISSPQLNGNLLVARIDGVPCTVTLQDRVVDAYSKGALPLNTLANAVLEKYDEQRENLLKSYDNELEEKADRELSRGIR